MSQQLQHSTFGPSNYQRLKEILEGIFTPEWFLHAGKTPSLVYERWAFCQQMIAQGGAFREFSDKMELIKLQKFLFDSIAFTLLTDGDVDQLRLGALECLGDEAVIKKLRGTVDHPEQYSDLMVEMYIAAWYKFKGHPTKMLQQTGWPDILVEPVGLSLPLFIECKRIDTTVQNLSNRIKKKIEDANTQVKRASKELGKPCYGVVVLDIASLFTFEEVQNPQLSSAKFKLERASNTVLATLAIGYTAINYVVLTWNSHLLDLRHPYLARCEFMFHRACFEHKRPVVFNPRLPLYSGHSIGFSIRYKQI